ncbi:ROK family protein [Pedococcus sp. 5OH_020]|uniref:ROK family protein n=1 Tax=Pedococcus sp. 5OH_020 TaxID=2989814 RepID=UPI0022E9C948|nr:ROK family protein [Pedococcus sp. 5OH_020]
MPTPVPTTASNHLPPSRTPSDPQSTSARQSSLRESNLGLVVRTVYASPTALSRAGVAGRTSLTRSTVSRLVDDLVAGGVLAELGQAEATGRGRPATPLVPGAGLAALGLQVNATYLAARVVDLRGTVVAERVEYADLVSSEPAPTLTRLAALSTQALKEVPGDVRLVGAGLALPGIVSADTGRLLLAPNLGWADVRPADLVRRAAIAGLTLNVGNEADLAARTVAEMAPGRPSSLRDFVYLSGEIGIGGAAIVDGQVMQGRHGWAGEIGHVCVDPDGPVCPCGATGCLEQYAGRRALLAAAGLPPGSTPAELRDAARSGGRRAERAVSRAVKALGIALAGVVNVLDIPDIVLGGDLGQIADVLAPGLEVQLRSRTLSARWVSPTIHTASDDPAPGATGAALRELSAVLAHPAAWLP